MFSFPATHLKADFLSVHPTFITESIETTSTPRRCRKTFPVNFSNDHLNSDRKPHHQVRRRLIYLLEGTPATARNPCASPFSSGKDHVSAHGWFSDHRISPPVLLGADKPIQLPHFDIRAATVFFKDFSIQQLSFMGFFACLP